MSDGIIFDHHALLAVGGGNRRLSGYIVAAHQDPLYDIAVPALCLAEAIRHRPGISAYFAQMPAVEIMNVDRLSADVMGRIAAALLPEQGWPALHAVATGITTGWEIATTDPRAYKGFGVSVLPVDP
ncbi:hypothetical protein V1L54_14525 [Streptomyces sp. TRM 70361]|uniref:hypothetical protein n=1 Tax=Streptomyces sp. TRM 70361 TaxID=3116553 RepID=UPI002E7BCA02|nr:hypothetical protein [Streptomyces sp. TRM 70361]MEE1940606.1 hypothetical protein [Streptomyces sp. TRM 70361]